MKLSILICTLPERKESFNEIFSQLQLQIEKYNYEIEILTYCDNGEHTLGWKRDFLVNKASGEYIVHVDDDDVVAFDYVDKIIEAIKSKPDCCAIKGFRTNNGIEPKEFIHSLNVLEWIETKDVDYKGISNLNPVRREFAVQAGHPDINYTEDRWYSKRITPLLKTQVEIPGYLYWYKFKSNSVSVLNDIKSGQKGLYYEE